MDAVLRLGPIAVLAVFGCTSLESGDDLLDAGSVDSSPDALDASPDAFDACADPPIGECPPSCMRRRISAGLPLAGVGHIVTDSSSTPNQAEWTCETIYVLEEDTFLEEGLTLTIGPGTLIEAAPGASLVVPDGSRLIVEGDRDAPVVIRPPSPYQVGDEWRGLYLLGHARVLDAEANPTRRDVNRLDADRDPSLSAYGSVDVASADPTHDCGSLRYLRLEFAGRTRYDTEAEALFIGGCGTETELDYLQVHESADDSIVIHGGGFDMRHIIVTTGDRDALQWERGWNGTVQHYVAHMPVASDHAVVQAEGPIAGAEPPSSAVIANMTTVATSTGRAIVVEGSSLLIGNSVAIQREQLMRVRDPHVVEWGVGDIEIRNSVLVTESPPYFEQAGLEALYAPPNNGNTGVDPMLPASGVSPVLRNPTWRPPAGSTPTETFGALPESVEATTYAGAIDPDPEVEDWTEGWTFYLSRI